VQFLTLADTVAMMLYADSDGAWLRGEFLVSEEGRDFIDVLCRGYLQACASVARHGLAHSYEFQELCTRRPRGRLDYRAYALSRLRHQDRLVCQTSTHTLHNDYNQRLADGLRMAARLVSDVKLRRSCLLLAERFSGSLDPRVARRRWLPYSGQFAPYEWPHRLAELLRAGSGASPDFGHAAVFLPFKVRFDLLFQRVVLRLVRDVLGSPYKVSERQFPLFEDAEGHLLRSRLVPDVLVNEAPTGRLVLVLDAKYEKSFPDLDSSDFYQAYVYGDVLGRHASVRPLPVVLVSPATSLKLVGSRRVRGDVDGRAHRPVTWVLGIPVERLVWGKEADICVLREQLRRELLAVLPPVQ